MNRPYYFIAIGGIGMSGLAKYLLEAGETVLGSDIKESKYTKKLEGLGAKIFIGHDEKNLPDDAVVIVSTAIKTDNPELQKAKRLICRFITVLICLLKFQTVKKNVL